jgi:hypothetical protein
MRGARWCVVVCSVAIGRSAEAAGAQGWASPRVVPATLAAEAGSGRPSGPVPSAAHSQGLPSEAATGWERAWAL